MNHLDVVVVDAGPTGLGAAVADGVAGLVAGAQLNGDRVEADIAAGMGAA